MAADPVVSPADTIRRLGTWVPPRYRTEFGAAVDEWEAVGERDKAEIERLRALPDDGEFREVFQDVFHVWPLSRARHPVEKCPRCVAEALYAGRERDRRQIARLTDLFKPEPYEGVRFKLVCASCGGRGEVPGRNHDDARWMQCLTCKGDGLSSRARAVLAGEEDARP